MPRSLKLLKEETGTIAQFQINVSSSQDVPFLNSFYVKKKILNKGIESLWVSSFGFSVLLLENFKFLL